MMFFSCLQHVLYTLATGHTSPLCSLDVYILLLMVTVLTYYNCCDSKKETDKVNNDDDPSSNCIQ